MLSHFLRARVQNTNVPVPTDPFFDQTTLLLHGDGTNGAQNNTFVSTTSSPYSYYVSFNGSSQTLSVANNTALNLSSGDFTIEAWVYRTGSNANAVICSKDGVFGSSYATYAINLNGSGYIQLVVGNALTYFQIVTSNTLLPTNQWVHIAAVKNGTNLSIYQNGISVASATQTGTMVDQGRALLIGHEAGQSSSFYWNGYISNVRIVKGTAVYTANFVPPTAPLTAISGTSLLTCQSPTIVDNSSNGFPITNNGNATVTSTISPTGGISGNPVNWYGTFNGSSQDLLTPSSTNLQLGTGDFTVELWYYRVSANSGSFNGVFGLGPLGTGNFGIFTNFSGAANQLTVNFYGASTYYTTGGTINAGQWYHIAVTRASSTLYIFLNGTQVGTASSVTTNITGTQATIGKVYTDQNIQYANGYISNVRVVKGTALYTAAFTPPQGTLPAVTNTSLLTLQSGAIVDSSSNIFPITNNGSVNMTPGYWQLTRNGNTTQGSFSPFSNAPTAWGNYFDGTGDTLTAPFSSANFDFGTGDFTVETWMYQTVPFVAETYRLIWQNYNGPNNSRIAVGFNGDKFGMFFNSTGIETPINSGYFTPNTWIHVAITRQSSTVRIFVNGVLRQTGSTSVDFNAGNDCVVGAQWLGYLSNLRIVKGTAVYTSGFTPSTSPLTAISGTTFLTCQSNRFRDNSANNLTITRVGDVQVRPFSPFNPTSAYSTTTVGGSGYFDGTGDYLSFTGITFNGDFCAECWYYRTANPTNYSVIFGGSGLSGANNHQFIVRNNNSVELVLAGNVIIASAGTAALPNQWNHIAWVRSGSNCAIFVNGVRQGTATSSDNTSICSRIGDIAGLSGYSPIGYVSDARIVIGSSVYDPTSSTVTVPTAPLTPVTNTSLLLNSVNAGIFDNTARNDLETVGNAQISTSVKKYGTGSLAFDGNGDYLVIPSSIDNTLGSGNWTIEFWIYFNTLPTFSFIYEQRSADTQVAPCIYTNSSNISFFVNGADRITGTGLLTTGTWYHFALAKSGSTTKMFLNGTQAGADYTDTNNYVGNIIYVGTRRNIQEFLNGYIDDLRVTKGVARYTANFTPPAFAFPDQ